MQTALHRRCLSPALFFGVYGLIFLNTHLTCSAAETRQMMLAMAPLSAQKETKASCWKNATEKAAWDLLTK